MTHPTYPDHTRHASGFYFHDDTPGAVADIIASAYATDRRVRIFCGESESGTAWPEEHDIIGGIGASTGPKRTALLINNRRSMGGIAILTHCIVAIQYAPGQFFYRHPTFNVGEWSTGPVRDDEYTSAAYHNGTLDAQFRLPDAAHRYCKFMRGERWSK